MSFCPTTSPFQSTPLIRGETLAPAVSVARNQFQSTPLIRGETSTCALTLPLPPISIHSPHTRGDEWRLWRDEPTTDISIHSPHTRGDGVRRGGLNKRGISIHSPHARGDGRRGGTPHAAAYFNPLPSCEGRLHKPITVFCLSAFQSTPLMRGETPMGVCC